MTYTDIREDKILTDEKLMIQSGDYVCGEDGLIYCGKCHSPKQVRITHQTKTYTMNCLCKCQTEERDEEEASHRKQQARYRAETMRSTGILNQKARQYTFENDNGRIDSRLDIAKRYVSKWEECKKKNLGILLTGASGTGKSFFAGCVANALIDNGVPVMLTTLPQLLTILGNLHGKDLEDYLAKLDRYDLFILDDYDPEGLSPYYQRLLYAIVDRRFSAGKPMIVATNLSVSTMKESHIDPLVTKTNQRIREMCSPVVFEFKDLRQNQITRRLQEARKRLGSSEVKSHAG